MCQRITFSQQYLWIDCESCNEAKLINNAKAPIVWCKKNSNICKLSLFRSPKSQSTYFILKRQCVIHVLVLQLLVLYGVSNSFQSWGLDPSRGSEWFMGEEKWFFFFAVHSENSLLSPKELSRWNACQLGDGENTCSAKESARMLMISSYCVCVMRSEVYGLSFADSARTPTRRW